MMWTINFTPGERKTWCAAPRVASGQLADLTGAVAELRIAVPRECLILPGTAQSEGLAFELSSSTLDLPPGRYATALWITWADGSAHEYGRGVLAVQKGC